MKKAHLTVAALITSIATLLFIITFTFRSTDLEPTGPAFLPRIYLGAMIIFGIILFIQNYRRSDGENKVELASMKRPLIGVGLVAVYLVLMNWTGFYLSTILFFIALLLLTKVRNPYVLIGLPVGTLIFLYLFFTVFLSVELPSGELFS